MNIVKIVLGCCGLALLFPLVAQAQDLSPPRGQGGGVLWRREAGVAGKAHRLAPALEAGQVLTRSVAEAELLGHFQNFTNSWACF